MNAFPGESMRPLAALLIIGAAACSSGLLEASTTPPNGLPVSVTTSFVPGIVPASGSITGKGDSVVALVSWPAVCNRTVSADAGTTDAGLVITILLTSQGVQNCSPLNGMTLYRASVHGVPAGTINASAHIRLLTNGANSDSSIVATTLRLP
jgi:hypothetical protein